MITAKIFDMETKKVVDTIKTVKFETAVSLCEERASELKRLDEYEKMNLAAKLYEGKEYLGGIRL